MKKIIAIVLLLIIILILMNSKSNKNNTNATNEIEAKINNLLETYDYLIGIRNSRNKKVLYGLKDGQLSEIDADYIANKSTFYRVTGTSQMITYFDYNTWYHLYEDVNHSEWFWDGYHGVGERDKDIFQKYYENYVYNIGEKQVFDNIVRYVQGQHKNSKDYYSIEYFFVREYNSYVAIYEHEVDGYVFYQYHNDTNTLVKLFDLNPSEEIEYFR